MADSSFRDGDALASSVIAAPTGSGSVHIQKVETVGADGTALTTTGNGTADSGTQRVTLASDSTGTVAISQTTPGTTNAVSIGYLGSAAINTGNGASGTGTLRVAIVSNQTPFGIIPTPNTSGGLSIQRLVGATNGVIKASAGQLYSGTFTNTNAAIRYLQIYNKATAGTLSTDTPALTVPLPPNVSVMVDFASMGGAFATGISWQFTTDDIAIPTTAGASTDIHGFCTYK